MYTFDKPVPAPVPFERKNPTHLFTSPKGKSVYIHVDPNKDAILNSAMDEIIAMWEGNNKAYVELEAELGKAHRDLTQKIQELTILQESPWNLGRISVDHEQWKETLEELKHIKRLHGVTFTYAIVSTIVFILLYATHVWNCHPLSYRVISQEEAEKFTEITPDYQIYRTTSPQKVYTTGAVGSVYW